MPRPGHVIALCVFALLCIGVVMVQSARMTVGSSADEAQIITFESLALSRTSAYMALSLVAMAVASRLPVGAALDARRLLGKPPAHPAVHPWLVAAVLGLIALLCLVYVPGLGDPKKGSHRWLAVPVFGSVQPSEFAKWGLVPVLAVYAAWQGPQRMARFVHLAPGLAIAGMLAGLVIIEDLGTGVLMLAAGAIVLIAGGGRLWQMLLMAPPAAAALAFAIFSSDYRLQRVMSFLDPFQDPMGSGYHMIQSMVAVANGEIVGRGLGFGLQKFGYLPEDTTDFLFAIICEELGVAGASLVVALYFAIFLAALSIIRRLPPGAPKLAAIGVVATMGIQAVINIGVVTGLGPTKGIALPLLSSGGTGWLLTAFSLGVLISLDRTTPPIDGDFGPRPVPA